MRIAGIAQLVAIALASGAGAQEQTWASKRIVLSRPGVEITSPDARGKKVNIPLDRVAYWVLEERDGSLKIDDHFGNEGWFKKADAVLLDDAVRFFSDRLRQNPQDVDALASRGFAHYMYGDMNKAHVDYDEAIRLDPKCFDAHFGRGRVWHTGKEYSKAVAALTEAIRLKPGFYVIFKRGNSWLEMRVYDKAIADYNESIRLNPTFALAFYNRGNARRYSEDYDNSIADYDETIRLDPKYVDAYHNRGSSWLDKKVYDKAIDDYTTTIKLDPGNLTAYVGRGNAWTGKKQFDKALKDLNRAIELDGKCIIAYIGRGVACRDQKQYEKALADLDEAVRLGPDSAHANLVLAWFWAACPDAKFRDGKRALEIAKKAVKLNSRGEVVEALAAAYAELGDFDMAVSTQQRALLDPSLRNDEEANHRLKLYQMKQPYRQE